jgi:hypothetical protein
MYAWIWYIWKKERRQFSESAKCCRLTPMEVEIQRFLSWIETNSGNYVDEIA